MINIAIVVPSIREKSLAKFISAWSNLIEYHKVVLVIVHDGDTPFIEVCRFSNKINALVREVKYETIADIMGTITDMRGNDINLIYNFNDGVRNLGFAYVAKYLPDIDIIISLDDDVEPHDDTIKNHLVALYQNVCTTWINSTNEDYMRGVPYNIRNEAEVWVSHGTWVGVPDYDAPSQLTKVMRQQTPNKCVVPKGILYPHCAMNFAFKREALPYVYQAPMGPKIGLDRFADIWGGIEMKKDLDRLNKAVVNGFSQVRHKRASNVYINLQKEAKGIEMNDHYGQDEYFKLFESRRNSWKEWIKANDSRK